MYCQCKDGLLPKVYVLIGINKDEPARAPYCRVFNSFAAANAMKKSFIEYDQERGYHWEYSITMEHIKE